MLAAALTALGAAPSGAAPLERLVGSTESFATDGVRYAAWASTEGPITVLDTRDDTTRSVPNPSSCAIDASARPAPRAIPIWCQGPASERTRVLDPRTGAISPRPWPPRRAPAGPGPACRALQRAAERVHRHPHLGSSDLAGVALSRGGRVVLRRCGEPDAVVGRHPWWAPPPLLSAGWLTWDTGWRSEYAPRLPRRAGALHAVDVRTGERLRWRLAARTIEGCSGSATAPFGSSSHTRERVFWAATLAIRELLGDCDAVAGRLRVFSARLP
ncbi:MAG TPA: hypothetical protein VIL49_12445 [Capillimicrobium sp.]